MMLAAIENVIIFHTVLSVLTFVFVVTVRVLAGHHLRPSPRSLTRLYTAAVVAPGAAAAWIVAAALVPPAWLPGPHTHDPRESEHLIQELTAVVEPFLAYAIVSLVAVAFIVATLATLRSDRRAAWAIRRLRVTAPPPLDPDKLAILEAAARPHGVAIAILDSDQPITFVAGVRRSTMAVSTRALCSLTAAQLAGLVEHELAHHERADNRLGFALRLVASLSLAAPLTHRVLRWRSEQVELLCDEIAASRTSAPLDIAEALVTLRRAAVAPTARALAVASFIPDDQGALTRRVHRLVELADHLPAPAPSASPPRRSLAAGLLLFGATLAGLTAWAPFAVHTAAESVLGFLR